MGVNGKAKGNRVEREVAKVLSKWWGSDFTRTPSSGMFSTTHATQLSSLGVDLAGDIICPKDFPFSVEVKSRKKIDLFDVARNGKDSEIWDWWMQSCRDANQVNKIPLVIFKENGKQFYAMLPHSLVLLTKSVSYLDMQNTFSSNPNDFCHITPLSSLLSMTKADVLSALEQFKNIGYVDIELPPDND